MAESGSQFRGLDLGTSRIVLARLQGDRVKFEGHLNAFVALPYARMTESMLEREGIRFIIEDATILAYGNRVDEFANIFNGDTRRPMQTGLLNPDEPRSLQMIEVAIQSICGPARKGEKLCFSVPAPPPGRESDLIYHEQTMTQLLESLGYEIMSLNEGLAVVYAELKDSDFTGIGISFGGGMCNVCVAYLGLPVLTFCTPRAGDYIDHAAASVTNETPTTVRLHKESDDFSLTGLTPHAVDQALSVYYNDVVSGVVAGIETALKKTKKLPNLQDPVPIAFSGGTALPGGFPEELDGAIRAADLPIEISEIRRASSSINATAKGTLVAAMLNM